jgi:hypothetical protein
MTILETFIQLRDDLKLWVTNNLKTKADIDLITVEDIDTICGSTIEYTDLSEVTF